MKGSSKYLCYLPFMYLNNKYFFQDHLNVLIVQELQNLANSSKNIWKLTIQMLLNHIFANFAIVHLE